PHAKRAGHFRPCPMRSRQDFKASRMTAISISMEHLRPRSSELAAEPDIRGVLGAAAIAVAADDTKRHAGVEAMGKSNAKSSLALEGGSTNLPGGLARRRGHRRARGRNRSGDAAPRLDQVGPDLAFQRVDPGLQ